LGMGVHVGVGTGSSLNEVCTCVSVCVYFGFIFPAYRTSDVGSPFNKQA